MDATNVNRQEKVLVLGATGKTGSRVAQRLKQIAVPIQMGSRSGEPPFDWTNEASWKPVLQGCTAAYITFQPDLAVPGADDAIRSFTEQAVESGVRRLVLLSGRGEPEAQACEQVVINAGVDWTILRASWFNQNFSEGYLVEPLREGYVALPVGNVLEPFIDADDIADVAVAALTQEVHAGCLYELTGPRLITFREAVEQIAQATGQSIQYETVPMQAYADLMIQQGVPTEYVDLLTYLFTEVLDGRNARLANGVEEALGRKPTDFADYVQRTAGSGIWATPVSI